MVTLMAGTCNPQGRCDGPSCLQGAKEIGPDGIPVCADGTPCKELAQGCEICPAPIFTVAGEGAGVQKLNEGDVSVDLRGMETGMMLYSFDLDKVTGVSVGISRQQTSVCTMLCWVYAETKQIGLSKNDNVSVHTDFGNVA